MSLELELSWFALVVAAMIGVSWAGPGSAGLSLAYLISLGFIHFWGGLIHVLPWYRGGEADFTQLGFHQFAWAVAGFALGGCLVAPLIVKRLPSTKHHSPVPGLAKIAIICGIILYGFLRTLLGGISSVGAVAGCGGALFVAGLCLVVWESLRQRKYDMLIWIFVAMAFLPFFTIISSGFLGYGAGAALVVVAFLACQMRPRIVGLLILATTIYFGFCTFMTYMRDRNDIRDEMWDEDSSFSQRLDRLKTTFTRFELLDFHSDDQLDRIEGRLNQNDLVGRAVFMLDNGTVNFAEGQTFRDAAISLVPRIFWPSKPVTAGSPDIVSYYTGEFFAPGTSVGIGQVMEGYVNFGTPGVVILFVVFGLALGICDNRAAVKLKGADTMGFIIWFVPGIGLLQPGGSLVEIAATVAASVVLVQGLKFPFAARSKKLAIEATDAAVGAARRGDKIKPIASVPRR